MFIKISIVELFIELFENYIEIVKLFCFQFRHPFVIKKCCIVNSCIVYIYITTII